MKTLSRFLKDESGATAIEYGLIATGIAIAIIAAVNGVGSKITTNLGVISTHRREPAGFLSRCSRRAEACSDIPGRDGKPDGVARCWNAWQELPRHSECRVPVGFPGGCLFPTKGPAGMAGQVVSVRNSVTAEIHEPRDHHCYGGPPEHAKPLPLPEVSKREWALRRACQHEKPKHDLPLRQNRGAARR
jgi:pilus assembly protein Flp/PilA